jgi:cytochrome c-type biogenesis protein CcmH
MNGANTTTTPTRARTRMSQRPLAALLSIALLLSAILSVAPATAVAPRTSLPVIEPQVMCVLCKIPLNVAESQQANYERAFIQEQINKGDTEAQVKKTLVAQYGPRVLGLPPASGFNLTVYLVPAAVVLALLAALFALLPSWRRHARTAASLKRPAPSLNPSDAARLDSDLARFN